MHLIITLISIIFLLNGCTSNGKIDYCPPIGIYRDSSGLKYVEVMTKGSNFEPVFDHSVQEPGDNFKLLLERRYYIIGFNVVTGEFDFTVPIYQMELHYPNIFWDGKNIVMEYDGETTVYSMWMPNILNKERRFQEIPPLKIKTLELVEELK